MSTDLTSLTNEPGRTLRDRFGVLLSDDTLAKREPAVRAAEAVLQRAKDEIDRQRDELIRRLERPLRSRYDVRNVFAPRWVLRV